MFQQNQGYPNILVPGGQNLHGVKFKKFYKSWIFDLYFSNFFHPYSAQLLKQSSHGRRQEFLLNQIRCKCESVGQQWYLLLSLSFFWNYNNKDSKMTTNCSFFLQLTIFHQIISVFHPLSVYVKKLSSSEPVSTNIDHRESVSEKKTISNFSFTKKQSDMRNKSNIWQFVRPSLRMLWKDEKSYQ